MLPVVCKGVRQQMSSLVGKLLRGVCRGQSFCILIEVCLFVPIGLKVPLPRNMIKEI
jgi:hypothetical protein